MWKFINKTKRSFSCIVDQMGENCEKNVNFFQIKQYLSKLSQ